MSTEPIELTREALYQLVWAEPMRTVAQRLGISDVGLAKKCRRMNIPVPGLGYWAKKAAGKRVRQAPLPVVPPNDSTTPRETTVYPVRPEVTAPGPVAAQLAFESDPKNEIRVADHLRAPHPLVKATIAAFDSTGRKGSDYVANRRVDHLDVDVTTKLLRRALRLMDALVKALEARGWPVSLGSGDDHKTYVTIFEQRIAFGIRETLKKVENEPEKPRRLITGEMYTPFYSKYRDEPSGKLALVLRNSWGHGVSKSRVESSSRPLETRLNDFVLTLVWEANEERERHERFRAEELRREEEAARRQAERDRLAALEARRAAEAARHGVLEQQASSWVRSREIRDYLAAVRAKLVEHPPVENEREIADWLEWAEAHASELDPLNRSVPELAGACSAAEYRGRAKPLGT